MRLWHVVFRDPLNEASRRLKAHQQHPIKSALIVDVIFNNQNILAVISCRRAWRREFPTWKSLEQD